MGVVTDEQVRLLRRKRMDGKSQESAAAAAGMSVRTARKWGAGALPSTSKEPRSWRTRRRVSESLPVRPTDRAGPSPAEGLGERVAVD